MAAGACSTNEGREPFASQPAVGHLIVKNALSDGAESQIEVIERAEEFCDSDEMGFGTLVAKAFILGAEVCDIGKRWVQDPLGVLFEKWSVDRIWQSCEVLFFPYLELNAVEIFGGNDARFHEQGGEVSGGAGCRVLGYRPQGNRGVAGGHIVDDARHRAALDPTDHRVSVRRGPEQVVFKGLQLWMSGVLVIGDQRSQKARGNAHGSVDALEPSLVVAASGTLAQVTPIRAPRTDGSFRADAWGDTVFVASGACTGVLA